MITIKTNQHVVPRGGAWAVRSENASRATRIFENKAPAVSLAHRIAMKNRAELVIHGRNGQIQDKDSFGRDPNPPKDKKH